MAVAKACELSRLVPLMYRQLKVPDETRYFLSSGVLLQFTIYCCQGCCGTVHLRKEHIAAIPGHFDELLAHFGRCGTIHVFEETLIAAAAGVVSDAGWALSSVREIEHVLDVCVVQPFDRGLLLPVVVKYFAPVTHDQVIVLVSLT